MTVGIKQFVYYGDNVSMNKPEHLSLDKMTDGTLFDGYYPIKEMTISGKAGISFYLNNFNKKYNMDTYPRYKLKIPRNDVYKFEKLPGFYITNLSFDREDLQNLSGRLIITIQYEKPDDIL